YIAQLETADRRGDAVPEAKVARFKDKIVKLNEEIARLSAINAEMMKSKDIHHEHHTTAQGAVHHATTSLMIPLLPAGTRADRTVVPWDASRPYQGMGWRNVSARAKGSAWEITQTGVVGT